MLSSAVVLFFSYSGPGVPRIPVTRQKNGLPAGFINACDSEACLHPRGIHDLAMIALWIDLIVWLIGGLYWFSKPPGQDQADGDWKRYRRSSSFTIMLFCTFSCFLYFALSINKHGAWEIAASYLAIFGVRFFSLFWRCCPKCIWHMLKNAIKVTASAMLLFFLRFDQDLTHHLIDGVPHLAANESFLYAADTRYRSRARTIRHWWENLWGARQNQDVGQFDIEFQRR